MSEKQLPPFFDLHRLSEDQRISMIVDQAREKLVGVCLERNQPKKIARYIEKVTAHDGIRHIATVGGPTARVVLVQFGPKVLS